MMLNMVKSDLLGALVDGECCWIGVIGHCNGIHGDINEIPMKVYGN